MESRIIFADDLRRSSLLVKRWRRGTLGGSRRSVWTSARARDRLDSGLYRSPRSTSISARTHHVRRRGPHRASSLYPPHARSWLGPARHLALTSIPCLPKPPSARLLARLIGLP